MEENWKEEAWGEQTWVRKGICRLRRRGEELREASVANGLARWIGSNLVPLPPRIPGDRGEGEAETR